MSERETVIFCAVLISVGLVAHYFAPSRMRNAFMSDIERLEQRIDRLEKQEKR